MRKKLKRFEENECLENILEPSKALYKTIKAHWKRDFFKNDYPITLELGAGRAIYTVELARRYPNRNFIGIDVKGDRLWHGATEAKDGGLKNAGFLRAEIQQLQDFFEDGEVAEIWITFPDPQPKTRNEKHRLTHDRYLNLYKKILIKGGIVHLKTDDNGLYTYTLQTLESRGDIKILVQSNDIYSAPNIADELTIKTHYEKRFLAAGKTIKYIAFRFKRAGFLGLFKRDWRRHKS